MIRSLHLEIILYASEQRVDFIGYLKRWLGLAFPHLNFWRICLRFYFRQFTLGLTF